MRGRVVATACFGFFFASSAILHAGDNDEREMASLLTAVGYLRNAQTIRSEGLRLGVVHLASDSSSLAEGQRIVRILKSFGDRKIFGRPILVEPVAYQTGSEFGAIVGKARLNSILICPGIDSVPPDLFAMAHKGKLLLLGTSRRHLEAGAGLGVDVASGKSTIMANLPELNAAGIQLDARMLRLAQMVSTVRKSSQSPQTVGSDSPVKYQAPDVVRGRRISGAEPDYPPIARKAKISAKLLVKLYISPEGRVSHMNFLKTHEVFEKSVREAISGWTFEPYKVNDRPIGTYTIYKFEFRPR
jgi:TonB family protein